MPAFFPVILILATFTSVAQSLLDLPAIFSDGCVLQTNNQYGARSRVYGTATPGAVISVELLNTNYTTIASRDGSWAVTTNPLRDTGDDFDFTVRSDEGVVKTFRGCTVGDVYVCSGQSNVRTHTRRTGAHAHAVITSPHPHSLALTRRCVSARKLLSRPVPQSPHNRTRIYGCLRLQ